MTHPSLATRLQAIADLPIPNQMRGHIGALILLEALQEGMIVRVDTSDKVRLAADSFGILRLHAAVTHIVQPRCRVPEPKVEAQAPTPETD